MDDEGTEEAEELDLQPVTVVRTPRRKALWAVLAVVAVAAGALVVTSTGDDAAPPPDLPVALGATRSANGAEAAADAMVAWVTYVPGDDLPALGGEATAYRLTGTVDEARVQALADALGLDGNVEDAGEGAWSVSGADGRGSLDVYPGGWSFYSGARDCIDADGSTCASLAEDCAVRGDVTTCTLSGTGTALPDCATTTTTAGPVCYPSSGSGCAPASDDTDPCDVPTTTVCLPDTACATPPASGGCAGDCIEPSEPEPDPDVDRSSADLPPEEDARRVALDVVAAGGLDVDGAAVTAEPGFDSWWVTVEPVLGGVPSGLQAFVEVGADLQVISGNGMLGDVEELGEYPRLDTRATIERANAQMGAISDVAVGGGMSSGSGVSGDVGTASAGGDADGTTTTFVDPSSRCEGPGCDPVPSTTIACLPQPDGRDICEYPSCPDPAAGPAEDCWATECLEAVAPADGEAVGAPEPCVPPGDPLVDPIPEPAPTEIVLTDAEPALVSLSANDGSTDTYLVPAYRFTAADGGNVDLPAVADEALAGPPSTDTTVPVTGGPEPVPEPQPCVVLEEQDPGSDTTHTVQTCPQTEEYAHLAEGEEPVVGVAYYVDIEFECLGFLLGGQTWVPVDREAVAAWERPGEPYEGGVFTLDAEDHGTFVGDLGARTKVADFRPLGPAEDIFCDPTPRP